ncbi:MAG: GxxExxY protein [Lentimicrobium sp.]|jgi:GxxExxY protein|nr:GxxExxY protein [Lentimicrobium sp.]
MIQKDIDKLSYDIIGYAIEVHKELGPGLLESVYEKCLVHLLKQNGYHVQSQQTVPLFFKGLELDCELRYDILVNNLVIVELKTVDALLPIHEAQLLTYLRLLQKPKGILINFNCTNIFKGGQRTFVTEMYRNLPAG